MLEVANLEVVYHSVLLTLQGVSLTVPEGSVVALLGPNGAGKTTTMRALTGLLPIQNGKITKGRIAFEGVDLVGMDPDEIIRLGIAQVMEGRRIFGDLTVEENLRAGGYLVSRASVRRGLDDAYERFPVLGERRHRHAGYLSGGEQQMLAIARALMARPKLLLLDEPSLGLAPLLVRQVGQIIADLNRDGMSVLIVEQNAAMARLRAFEQHELSKVEREDYFFRNPDRGDATWINKTRLEDISLAIQAAHTRETRQREQAQRAWALLPVQEQACWEWSQPPPQRQHPEPPHRPEPPQPAQQAPPRRAQWPWRCHLPRPPLQVAP